MKYNIREMKAEDIDTVASLYKQMYQEQKTMGMVFDFNEETLDSRLQIYLKSKFNMCLVLEDIDGQVVGMAINSLVKIPNKYTLENDKLIGFIDDVYIEKSHRKKNLGGLLVKEVEKRFRDLGINYVELNVLNENSVGKMFWKSLGFNDVIQVMYKKL
ncbi:GNAT family N-acetyltransferase [Gottschalkia purinilytica]|nr:GNAT family N-acetyltransferase [Gottschalkia purinilytica]